MRRILLAALTLAPLSCGYAPQPPEEVGEAEGPSFEVVLEPRGPDTLTGRALRWSPYGKRLPLGRVDGGLETELALGPEGAPPIALRLSRSGNSPYFDQLWVDLDRGGTLRPDEVYGTTPSETRGRFWSSFSAVVHIPVTDPLTGRAEENPYPLDFWYVEDPNEPHAEPILRFSRRGWMEGRVILDGVEAVMMLTENEMDGVFGPGDSWALASADSADQVLQADRSRSVEDHAWLLEQAYRIQKVDVSGRKALLSPFDPGITRAAEEEMNDHLKVDREAPRSGRRVAFLEDFSQAQAQARAEGRMLFVDFETVWCGPCKIMEEWVYTADPVVEASQGVVAVKVDGDDFPELKRRFEVSGFPTLILLDPEGGEIRRLSGYVNVADMTAFLEGGS